MNFSNRLTIFLLGLSVGLLVGAGFFIFKIDDYLSKMSLFKSGPDTIVAVTQNKTEDKKDQASAKKWEQTKKTVGKDSLTVSKNDSVKVISSNLKDSLVADSSLTVYNPHPDDIVVKKDEMVSAKVIDVTNVTPPDPKNPKDSILQKESGIRDDTKNSVNAYQVEFWQSPINYKGYKMLKNKIVLFGIAQNENLKLFKIEDGIYMKQQQNVYRLAFTSDFKQFENVKDQTVLAKLK
jgi:hypothetical protein